MEKIKNTIKEFIVKLGILWLLAEVVFLGKGPDKLEQRVMAWVVLIVGVIIWMIIDGMIQKINKKGIYCDTDLEIKYGDPRKFSIGSVKSV
jgi:hypothetical protein